MTRVIASLVVLAMLSPALATITCDAACALAAADAAAPAMDMATCHEHQAHRSGASVMPTSSGPCHDTADAQAAVLADSLQLTALAAPEAVHATSDGVRATLVRVPTAPARAPDDAPRLTSQLRI